MVHEPYETTFRFSAFVMAGQDCGFASLSESPEGASGWHKFDLKAIEKPLNWAYSKLLYTLSKYGEDPENKEAKKVGKNLYKVFFAGEVGKKFDQARSRDRGVRLVIDVSNELVDIPWEVLHDGDDFLMRRNISIIRIVAELRPGIAYFGPISRLGLVAVTPDFNADSHITELENMLKEFGIKTEVCLNPTRHELMNFLSRKHIEALYFLGHGKKGQIRLRSTSNRPGSELVDAGDLAQWLPESMDRRINLVFLSSCGTAEFMPEENVFSGVAQRLMLSGRVGSVVAMQAKIGLNDALTVAEKFLDDVVHKGDPEMALLLARTMVSSIWARSIPVLYTHVDGPNEFIRNRLARLLETKIGKKVGVLLPGFRMGLKSEDYDKLKKKIFKVIGSKFKYRGATYAQSDFDAAKELLNLLTQVGDLSNVVVTDKIEVPGCLTTFVFGSRSQDSLVPLLKNYAKQFNCEFLDEVWNIVDLQNNKKYEVPSPDKFADEYNRKDDWGFIEKAKSDGRCYFFLCGLGDRATRGCAYFLAEKWQELLNMHLDRPFAVLLRFPGGLDFSHGEIVDRTNNEFGTLPRITPVSRWRRFLSWGACR